MPAPPALLPYPSREYVLQTMGLRIRAWREHRELTQGQLAEVLGVAQNWVSRVEAGRIRADASQLRMICLVLQMDPHVLLLL